MWGVAYDLTGSYTLALICGAVLLVIAMGAHYKTLKS